MASGWLRSFVFSVDAVPGVITVFESGLSSLLAMDLLFVIVGAAWYLRYVDNA